MLVENTRFFLLLDKAFEDTKQSGTLNITTKRGTLSSDTNTEYDCLIRVKVRHKTFSTRVCGSDLNQFNTDYSNLCKLHMNRLKKKEKKKK